MVHGDDDIRKCDFAGTNSLQINWRIIGDFELDFYYVSISSCRAHYVGPGTLHIELYSFNNSV